MEVHQTECCELGSVVYEDVLDNDKSYQSVLLPPSTIFPCDQCNTEFSDRGELQKITPQLIQKDYCIGVTFLDQNVKT